MTLQLSPHPRRTHHRGQGESSREGSAESNDEEVEDTASLSAAPSLTSQDSFEPTSLPSFATPPLPNTGKHSKRFGGAAGPGRGSGRRHAGEGEAAEASEGSAGREYSSLAFPINPLGKLELMVTFLSLSPDFSDADDGDISSATAPRGTAALQSHDNSEASSPRVGATASSSLLDSTPPSPRGPSVGLGPASRHPGHGGGGDPSSWAAAPTGFLSNLTAEEIQDHIKIAIAGDPGRAYRIMEPPQGRPVRIYADGVYDLLHYGHMLQLRQCKLAFPSVHLMVGVCSDELVRRYKSAPVLNSSERYESVRHCKWVDEVVEDAPWNVDAEFFKEHRIDYVAHDEEPYVSAGSEDVYSYAKSIGAFLPTKRTNGVSTSELLQRIVEGYREGDYDVKLIKLGHRELCSRQGSETGTHGSKHSAAHEGDDTVESPELVK